MRWAWDQIECSQNNSKGILSRCLLRCKTAQKVSIFMSKSLLRQFYCFSKTISLSAAGHIPRGTFPSVPLLWGLLEGPLSSLQIFSALYQDHLTNSHLNLLIACLPQSLPSKASSTAHILSKRVARVSVLPALASLLQTPATPFSWLISRVTGLLWSAPCSLSLSSSRIQLQTSQAVSPTSFRACCLTFSKTVNFMQNIAVQESISQILSSQYYIGALNMAPTNSTAKTRVHFLYTLQAGAPLVDISQKKNG